MHTRWAVVVQRGPHYELFGDEAVVREKYSAAKSDFNVACAGKEWPIALVEKNGDEISLLYWHGPLPEDLGSVKKNIRGLFQ